MPNVKKAVIRSPEVAIFGTQRIIENIQFPLDSSAQDLLKFTVSKLPNADNRIREAAIGIAVGLTTKSEIAVVQKLLNTFFDQFADSKDPEAQIDLIEGLQKIINTVDCSDELKTKMEQLKARSAATSSYFLMGNYETFIHSMLSLVDQSLPYTIREDDEILETARSGFDDERIESDDEDDVLLEEDGERESNDEDEEPEGEVENQMKMMEHVEGVVDDEEDVEDFGNDDVIGLQDVLRAVAVLLLLENELEEAVVDRRGPFFDFL